MKKSSLIVFCLIFIFRQTAISQDSISLEKCRKAAIENFPMTRCIDLYSKSGNYLKAKSSASNYPKINLSTQASWQSDVTHIDLSGVPFPITITSPPNDQFKALLEFNQLIYDAGLTKKLIAFQQAETEINIAGIKVEQYKIEEQVIQLYFNVLLINKQLELNYLQQSLLKEKLKKAEAGVKNGILLQSQADILKAELLKTEQQNEALLFRKKSFVEALSLLTGLSIAENSVFGEPNEIHTSPVKIRPEEMVFEFQKKLIEKRIELLTTNRLPKIYAFGQAGYGRPGLNFLSNDFKPYAIFGAGMNWNIWDWKQVKNEKSSFEIQMEIIETKRQSFRQSMELLIISERNNILKYESAIEKDQKIIELREHISQMASSQLDHGSITPTEYLVELNAEIQAKLNLELNKLLLAQSKLNLEFLKGY